MIYDHLAQTTYKVATSCDLFIERFDVYACEVANPVTKCTVDSDCAPGQLCMKTKWPSNCVTCNTSKPQKTYFIEANVTLNVTESMLQGHFWNTDRFYNNTDDLVLDL